MRRALTSLGLFDAGRLGLPSRVIRYEILEHELAFATRQWPAAVSAFDLAT
jgi:hypothetical protein